MRLPAATGVIVLASWLAAGRRGAMSVELRDPLFWASCKLVGDGGR